TETDSIVGDRRHSLNFEVFGVAKNAAVRARNRASKDGMRRCRPLCYQPTRCDPFCASPVRPQHSGQDRVVTMASVTPRSFPTISKRLDLSYKRSVMQTIPI